MSEYSRRKYLIKHLTIDEEKRMLLRKTDES